MGVECKKPALMAQFLDEAGNLFGRVRGWVTFVSDLKVVPPHFAHSSSKWLTLDGTELENLLKTGLKKNV